ncbi:acVLRF1 family peptidyl-tRNA hydrolase [Psychromicrobium xiongbiense]|uniref:acVLRF1 family peptidyl-tRNA hydrolase n=1 Tax=Psychromicrobium xiongbiense TaxID=3051184 RepID=UPI002555FC04|nr:acVLRF1 family peptidyl-tRNA hydrolase [Psychromicrobium sp. YIM S02556]
MVSASRTAWVPGARLGGWTDRFAASHGAFSLEEHDDGLQLSAQDGARATLLAPWPVDGRPGRGPGPLERLASLASQPRPVVVLLIRRGGYGIGLCRGGILEVSKVGTRHVQSRTAAGGWSQQRFARRRANQADAMVEAVAAHAAALPLAPGEYLALGGDKAMAAALMAEPVLAPLAALPRLAFLDVQDPRAKVMAEAVARLSSVKIRITDPKT